MADRIKARSYVQWVLNLIRMKASLTKKDYAAAAGQNISTLVRTGTTTVGEICTHGVSSEVIDRSGLRAAVFHEVIAMRPLKDLSSVLPKGFHDTPLVHHGFSPHSAHTVSEKMLKFVLQASRKRKMPVAMHVAETAEETRLLRGEQSGLDRLYRVAAWDRAWAPRDRSTVAYLARTGILDIPFLAVHAVQVSDTDLQLIRKTGTAVAHCPRSNQALGVGVMPLRRMLDLRIPVGLGTDSLASVPTLSLWDEMRSALRTHRKFGVTAWDILRLATIGGAQALGMETEIGSIEPGKQADLIAVPLPLRSTGDLASDLLRETKSCTMTMVNGRILHRQTAPDRRQTRPLFPQERTSHGRTRQP